jgi:hypothetical protein
MPKHIVERDGPGSSRLPPEELQGISSTSCSIFKKPSGSRFNGQKASSRRIKVYCVFIAPNEAMIRAHANEGGFPANGFRQIVTKTDP